MKTCAEHSPHTWSAEWIDRRLPYFRSLRSADLCADCLDELEADEFVEIVSVDAIAN